MWIPSKTAKKYGACVIVDATFYQVCSFRSGSVVKNSPANAGDTGDKGSIPGSKRQGFDPWVEEIPWRRAWKPTPAFLLGDSHGQRSLCCSPPGCKEVDTIEATKHSIPDERGCVLHIDMNEYPMIKRIPLTFGCCACQTSFSLCCLHIPVPATGEVYPI